MKSKKLPETLGESEGSCELEGVYEGLCCGLEWRMERGSREGRVGRVFSSALASSADVHPHTHSGGMVIGCTITSIPADGIRVHRVTAEQDKGPVGMVH